MLRGYRKAFLHRQRQAVVRFHELTSHVRLPIDVARAGMRLDDEIERPFRWLKALRGFKACYIPRRHCCETGITANACARDEGFGAHQFARGHEQHLVGQRVVEFQCMDEGKGERPERRG